MNKRDVLKETTFGAQVAEDEVAQLSSYFVETDEWRRIFSGMVDVIYGPKGAGKSAIYFLLLSRQNELAERGIKVIAAENPKGAPVFKDLVAHPPTDEDEFRALWKLYFLSLLADFLRHNGTPGSDAKRVI